ncbi:hypothetical protein GALMADRAFT_241321 [Galerina marginata CBS 339.88]|uniref:Uncharacterized protein n=1 Tax=Galerina marginata (strain CBS 339.88) TaxID=685588 RepID=A0A067TLR0_GALM3|nr:hypothetical protein GALMADRAFT_241321 [Galerina marginata CBS 339.88]
MAFAPCRICLDDLKKPVSLPCGKAHFQLFSPWNPSDRLKGHVFCSDCIVETVKAIKPYTHMHPCPICRSIYNVAPVKLSIIPPNLRPFVTPSVRKLFLDKATPGEDADVENQPETSSSLAESSELSRLRAENLALRNNCALWRRRAEMHGNANLGLLNFARAVRDQASALARERDGLQKHCHALKRKIEDDRISRYSDVALAGFFSDPPISGIVTDTPDPDSLLFAPPPFHVLNCQESSPKQCTPKRSAPVDQPSTSSNSDLPPRKRVKITDSPNSPELVSAQKDVYGTGAEITRNTAPQRQSLENVAA